ncbi:MAG: DNA polymerase IV [Candidatus Merdivicinus sp.]|jgi:DNA polymerase-4
MERVILHSDLNSFYASVECLKEPSLREKPVAVGGDVESRHGIILTRNQLAKPFGVRVGQTIWEAKQCCPDLVVVPPHFAEYQRYSRLVRNIYEEYTDQVEPFGIDEAWLDVTQSRALFGSGRKIADRIRERVHRELGLTVSVGVSFNKVFAKLASDLKKPDATTEIPRQNFREIVFPLPVCDLLFVGWSTAKKFRDYGVYTIGDLANTDVKMLKSWLGKSGEVLHAYANGWDNSPVAKVGTPEVVKSVGNSTTCPRDLRTNEDARLVITMMAEEVSRRLREQNLQGKTVVLFLRDNMLKSWERQTPMKRYTNVCAEIAQEAYALFQRVYHWPLPLRGLGVRVTDLIPAGSAEQCFLFGEETHQRRGSLDQAVDAVRRRFGENSVRRALLLTDPQLSHLDPNIQSSLQNFSQSATNL